MTALNISEDLNNTTCDIFDNSLPVKTGMILAFSIIFLSGLVGNILIIMTVCKRQELQKTVNYFIVNMAVSDFVFPLTAIPVGLIAIATGSQQWYVGGTAGLAFCKMQTYLGHVSVFVSLVSLVWIALDRFVAVVLPMKVHLISWKFRAFAIATTWILSVVINSLDLYTYGLTEENKVTICKYQNNEVFSFMNDGKVHVYVLHVFPLFVLTILYCVIVVVLRKQDKRLGSSGMHKKDQRKQKAMKMSLCVIAAFCICNLPLTLENIFQDYKVKIPCKWSKPFSFIADIMFYLSSAINPIICFLFVGSYRRGLRELFNFKKKGKKPENGQKGGNIL